MLCVTCVLKSQSGGEGGSASSTKNVGSGAGRGPGGAKGPGSLKSEPVWRDCTATVASTAGDSR